MIGRRQVLSLVAGVALGCSSIACGTSDTSGTQTAPAPAHVATTEAQPATTAPATTAPATTAPAATAPATVTAPAAAPEDQPGGAGDEEPIRVPAAFTVSGTSVSPGRISVPASLPVGLSFRSADGAAHEVLVRTPEPTRLSVATGQSAQTTLPGQPAGLFLIEVDGTPTGAALAVGGDPGP